MKQPKRADKDSEENTAREVTVDTAASVTNHRCMEEEEAREDEVSSAIDNNDEHLRLPGGQLVDAKNTCQLLKYPVKRCLSSVYLLLLHSLLLA
jgi:hypothetical protein